MLEANHMVEVFAHILQASDSVEPKVTKARLGAVTSLIPFAKRGDHRAVAVLRRTLANDWNAPVKNAAGEALIQVAKTRGANVAHARKDALEAIGVLARFGSSEAVLALGMAAEDENAFVRQAALASLTEAARESDSVQENRVKAKVEALRILGRLGMLGELRAVDVLDSCSTDWHAIVKKAAIEALAAIIQHEPDSSKDPAIPAYRAAVRSLVSLAQAGNYVASEALAMAGIIVLF